MHLVVYPDWEERTIGIEIAESITTTRFDALQETNQAPATRLTTEETYTNYLVSLFADKHRNGVYDYPYTDGTAATSAAACQAQSPETEFFVYSEDSGLCQFYDPVGRAGALKIHLSILARPIRRCSPTAALTPCRLGWN